MWYQRSLTARAFRRLLMQLLWSDGAVANHAESWVTGSRAHGYFLRSSDKFWIEARERLHMLLCFLNEEPQSTEISKRGFA